MSTVLHLLKKDLRRSQLLLAFWLLLVALQYLSLQATLNFGASSSSTAYSMMANLGPTLRSVVLVVMIALLIQEEPVAGTTGFWLTRPISRSAVIRTKMIFVAFFVLCPLLVELSVLAANGVTAHDLALAAPEIVLGELPIVLLAVAFAAVTPNFARFTVAVATAGVVYYLLSFGVRWVGSREEQPSVFFLASAHIESEVLCLIGLTIAVLYQYLTRRTSRAIVLISLSAVLSILVSKFGLWNFFPKQSATASTLAITPGTIHIRLFDTYVSDDGTNESGKNPSKNISGQLLVEGLPNGYLALPTRAIPRLTLPNGESVPTGPAKRSNFIYEPQSSLFDAAFGKVFVYGRRSNGRTVPSGLAAVDAVNFARNIPANLTLSDEINFDVAHLVIVHRTPLKKGTRMTSGSDRSMIMNILREGEGIEVLLESRSLNLAFNPSAHVRPWEKYLLYPIGTDDGKIYVLFNPRRHEVIRTKLNGIHFGSPTLEGRLVVRSQSFSFGSDRYTLVPRLDDDWLSDAELVVLELSSAAEFTQQLEVKDFRLEGPNKPKIPIDEDQPADPEWLTRFKLPENASKTEMRAYVDDLITAAQYWHEDNWRELPVELLSKVGPGNADVLLSEMDRAGEQNREGEMLRLAILRTAGVQDKATILNALKTDTRYVDLVAKYHWEKDCSETLIQGLKDPKKDYLPKSWIASVVSLKDPSTFPDLKAYLLRAKNRKPTYNALSRVPGLDLRATAEQVWALAKNESEAVKIDAAPLALDFGNTEALATAAEVLRKNDLSQQRLLEDAASLLKRHLATSGESQELVAWYYANKAKLVFNPVNRKFYPKDAMPAKVEESSPM